MRNFPFSARVAVYSGAFHALSIFGTSAWAAGAGDTSRGRPSVDVLTYHNDPARTGQQLAERDLTPQSVGAPGGFGKRAQFAVDGQVYAQPLYVSGLKMPSVGKRNVLFVVTEHDSVYAFDADNADPNAPPLWKRSFLDPAKNVTSVPSDEVGSGSDLTPEIGITGTPVIDRKRGTLYVVAKTKEGPGMEDRVYVQRLHALDLATGNDRDGSPVQIDAAVPGHGDGNQNGIVHFFARKQNQRAGLLLADGVVYIAWASHADQGPYHGWMMAYDAKSLKQLSYWNDDPEGGLSGIWMSAAGIAADDDNNLYFSSGNGSADPSKNSYGDSFMRMRLDKKVGLTLTDYFMPFNHEEINAQDADLCSGLLLLPADDATKGKHLVIGGGKQGWLYLMDCDNMGKVGTTKDNVVQRFNPGNAAFDEFGYYRDTLYFSGVNGALRAFRVENGGVRETPLTETATHFGFPGTSPSVSAEGDKNAIVWAIENGAPGALHAYDAADLRRELWSSRTSPRDDMGQAMKFTVPTVADGKVFVGGANRVTVYGLLPTGATAAIGATGVTATDTVAATLGPVAGLVGRWAFDEGSGTIARDVSVGAGVNGGNSDANGDVQGEITRIGGVVGSGALDFHGVGNAVSRVVIPDRPRFRFGANDSVTFAVWVNLSASIPADHLTTVFARINPAPASPGATPVWWGLFVGADHRWLFANLTGAAGTFALSSDNQLAGGNAADTGWHHLAVVQDGAAHTRTLYVDGKSVASAPAGALDAPGDLDLGGAPNLPKSSLIGGLDDFRVYSRALGKDEIGQVIAVGSKSR